jgi:hypothetical protein
MTGLQVQYAVRPYLHKERERTILFSDNIDVMGIIDVIRETRRYHKEAKASEIHLHYPPS